MYSVVGVCSRSLRMYVCPSYSTGEHTDTRTSLIIEQYVCMQILMYATQLYKTAADIAAATTTTTTTTNKYKSI